MNLTPYVALINEHALRLFAKRAVVAARLRYRPRRCRSRWIKTYLRREARRQAAAPLPWIRMTPVFFMSR